MYMCVCVCIRMYTCAEHTYTCIGICRSVDMDLYRSAPPLLYCFVYTPPGVPLQRDSLHSSMFTAEGEVRTCIYIYIYIDRYRYININIYVCMCVYIHIYICTAAGSLRGERCAYVYIDR